MLDTEYEYEYEIFIARISQKHQGKGKYINKDIWIPTHYKQIKTLSENTE